MSKTDSNPGILNLHASLLSTRRPLFRSRQPPPLPTPQYGIPFSWEFAPGLHKSSYHHHLHQHNHAYYCSYDNPASARHSFSTTDVFSLSEAIDVLEKSEGPAAQESYSDLTAFKRMADSGEDTSPSFMINRFLPDANALAASSSLRYYYYSRSWNNKTSYSSYSSGSREEVEAEGKRYGMKRVFQWRMKPRFLCGNRRNPSPS